MTRESHRITVLKLSCIVLIHYASTTQGCWFSEMATSPQPHHNTGKWFYASNYIRNCQCEGHPLTRPNRRRYLRRNSHRVPPGRGSAAVNVSRLTLCGRVWTGADREWVQTDRRTDRRCGAAADGRGQTLGGAGPGWPQCSPHTLPHWGRLCPFSETRPRTGGLSAGRPPWGPERPCLSGHHLCRVGYIAGRGEGGEIGAQKNVLLGLSYAEAA